MRDKKGLGFFCKIADCLFVNRRKIWGLPEEISAIAKILEQGGNVTVFPEATTSAGCSILPFKSSLIQAAVNAGAAVQTYAIRFDKVKGRVCDSEDRNLYCWYGDMDFTPHFLKLLKLKNLELSIKSVCYEGLTLCRKTTTRNSFEAVKKWTSDRRVYTHLDSNQKWNWVSAFVPFLGLKGFVRRR
jgi:1-acyl-sn-glycerol-3-phosphate acyltransferase